MVKTGKVNGEVLLKDFSEFLAVSILEFLKESGARILIEKLKKKVKNDICRVFISGMLDTLVKCKDKHEFDEVDLDEKKRIFEEYTAEMQGNYKAYTSQRYLDVHKESISKWTSESFVQQKAKETESYTPAQKKLHKSYKSKLLMGYTQEKAKK